LKKLPKCLEQHITQSKNLLRNIHYISNPKQQSKNAMLNQYLIHNHGGLFLLFQNMMMLSQFKLNLRALRSTHIFVPTDIFEQQQVELVALQNIAERKNLN
jgi:hypothetical protein